MEHVIDYLAEEENKQAKREAQSAQRKAKRQAKLERMRKLMNDYIAYPMPVIDFLGD